MKVTRWRNQRFEYLKELSIGYVSVVVHIVNAESKPELGFLVALHAELGNALDKLWNIKDGKSFKELKSLESDILAR